MYALDTNTVLDFFRNRGAVAANLLAVPPRELALPAVVVYEVWFGVICSQNRRTRQVQYEHFLASVVVLPFDSGVARRAAELRHGLEQRGENRSARHPHRRERARPRRHAREPQYPRVCPRAGPERSDLVLGADGRERNGQAEPETVRCWIATRPRSLHAALAGAPLP